MLKEWISDVKRWTADRKTNREIFSKLKGHDVETPRDTSVQKLKPAIKTAKTDSKVYAPLLEDVFCQNIRVGDILCL